MTGALLDVTSFTAQNGNLAATGSISDAQDKALASAVYLPSSVAEATCEIFKLDLGPLELNLLALRVQLLDGGPLARLGAVFNFLNQLIRIFG